MPVYIFYLFILMPYYNIFKILNQMKNISILCCSFSKKKKYSVLYVFPPVCVSIYIYIYIYITDYAIKQYIRDGSSL